MKSYLKRKGYAADEIATTVDALVARGLIDDRRYSKMIARHSSARGKGPGYIRMKLRGKGVQLGAEEAKTLFRENSSESEAELAQRILQSRYPTAHECPKARRRAYQGLIRRGISHEVAQLSLKMTVAVTD